jgi:hypothetical protein
MSSTSFSRRAYLAPSRTPRLMPAHQFSKQTVSPAITDRASISSEQATLTSAAQASPR